MSDTTPRPSQTTVAAGTVIVGAALAVVSVGEQLAGINSLETRTGVADFVDQAGTGLDVETALLGLRVGLMVVAGCATAAVVLGVHVLRRSLGARLGLTLVAVPLFVVGSATGSFFALLAALSTIWLWVEPSRAWLERRALPEPRPGAERREGRAASPWGAPVDRPEAGPPAGQSAGPSASSSSGPPPHQGEFGAALAAHVAPPLAPHPPSYAVPAQRPSALVWACVLTWALCSLTAALLTASLAVVAVDPGLMWEELERQNPALAADSGLTRGDVVRTAYVMLGIGIAWSVLAALLAVLAYRRSNGGRIGLLVCALVAALLCLVASFGPSLLILPAMACALCAGLLNRREVRAWFAARPPLGR